MPVIGSLLPEWPEVPGVGALMTERNGGVSAGPWAALNLGVAVGDDSAAVAENRSRFAHALGARPVWLRQVHGRGVLHLTPTTLDAPEEPADAAWTVERGIACTVLAADCLPVLFALRDGRAVAAAHAGWRGLATGVLQATVQALCQGASAHPAELQAWLGACIGPRQFEVGADVLRAFGQAPGDAALRHFVSRSRPDGAPRWLANLAALAREQLLSVGVRDIIDAGLCTVESPARFFSYRRDGVTGRMAAAIWRR